MFGLIRRISGSVLPRPDRAWDEDATSTAPTKTRKRLLSTTSEDAPKVTKRPRASVLDTVNDDGTPERETTPVEAGKETNEVKEVTKGVKQVEITEGVSETDEHKTETTSESSDAPKLPDAATRSTEPITTADAASKQEKATTADPDTASQDPPPPSTHSDATVPATTSAGINESTVTEVPTATDAALQTTHSTPTNHPDTPAESVVEKPTNVDTPKPVESDNLIMV